MKIKDFRAAAHDLVDWMADYLEQVDQFPVRPAVHPGDILRQLPAEPPSNGQPWRDVLADIDEIVLPGMMHWQHPGFFGYFNANSSVPSVLAEMVTATMGAQCMSWETSPAATELETRMMEWLRDMLGLPATFTGSIHDTASTASMVALVVARERVGELDRQDLTVYCSVEAHSSIQKAVRLAGLNERFLRKIPVCPDQSLDPVAFREQVDRDLAAGLRPACVAACLGTTGASGFDPLPDIAEVAQQHDIWLHVDAAWAGSALILPEHRWMIEGVEHADSFVMNPHKWLGVNFDCSALYVRDVGALVNTMGVLPEYLKTAEQDVVNYRDWGVQLGRRFRALKLWAVIRCFGVSGLQQMIRNHIEWAHELAGAIAGEPGFRIVREPVLSLFCFRHEPDGLDPAAIDDWNARLLRAVNASGSVYLTHTKLAGRFVIRFVSGQTYTTRKHVMSVLSNLRAAVSELETERSG